MIADLPLAALDPMVVLLAAILVNAVVCAESVVGPMMATPLALASRAIAMLERRYNRPSSTAAMRRADSVSLTVVLLIFGVLAGLLLEFVFARLPYSWILEALLIAMMLAPRSHYDRAAILHQAFDRSLEEAQAALALLTGRDPVHLDRGGVARAAVEESPIALTAGFLAPIFWYVLFGLPGLLAFTLVDVARSMIDERADHARSFGWGPRYAAAALTVPAAVLSVAIVPLAAFFSREADAGRSIAEISRAGHYAWPAFSLPVAGFAGALGVKLGGAVCIGSFERKGDWIGKTFDDPAPEDICRARRLFVLCCAVTAALVLLLALLDVGQPLAPL